MAERFQLKVSRFGAIEEHGFESVDDAISFAASCSEHNEAYPISIREVESCFLLERESLWKAISEKWDEWERESKREIRR